MIFAIVAAILNASTPATPGSQTPNVFITTINCPTDENAVPALRIGDSRYGEYRDQQSSHSLLESGKYSFSLELAPGHYFLEYQTPNCNSVFPVAVLSGVDRHAVARLSHSINHVDAACSIAGTLPISGLFVTIVYPKGIARPATIDGRAYYLEYLAPLKYHLQVEGASGPPLTITIDLSSAPKEDAASCTLHMIRDVTLDEL
jgi:hypothetical protein